jgi:uncharacterized delta-60 repeat protein
MKLRLLALSTGCALAASTMVPAHAACTAGQFDSSFGPASSAGYVQVSPWVSLSSSTGFESLVFGGDSNVYVTGAVAVDGVSTYPYAGVMRTARGGAIDRSYGGMGVVIPGGQAAPAISSGPNADIAVDANGNLVAAVITGTGMSISRFLPDGTRDTAFGTGGVTAVALTNPWYLLGVQVAPDGSVFVGTSATNPASPSNLYQPVIVKLTSTGALDGTFGSGGIAFVYPSGLASNSNARMADIALLPSGDIIGVGRLVDPAVGAWFQAFVTRIHSNGSLDTTFGTSGFTIMTAGPTNNFILRKVLVQPDGKIVGSGATTAFGGSSSLSTVARLNGDGSLDSTFGTAGVSRFLPAFDSFVVHSALQDNGKIVLAIEGFADAGDTIYASVVARLTTTGALDANFNGSGSMTIPAAGPTAGDVVQPVNVKVNNHRIFTSTQVYTPDLQRYSVFLVAIDAGNGAHCY